MSSLIDISIEQRRHLPKRDVVQLLETALAARPAKGELRATLAGMLNDLDRHDEAIDLLTAEVAGDPDFDGAMELARAAFHRNASGDLDLAEQGARKAEAAASSAAERARAIAERAKVALLRADREQGVKLLEEAISIDPLSRIAFKRLSLELLRSQQGDRVLELCDQVESQGAAFARSLGARTMALALLGRPAEARELLGHQRFVHHRRPGHPEGWQSPQEFHAALEAELIGNPELRYGRNGTSSTGTWRVDAPQQGETPAVDALLAMVVDEVQDHVSALPAGGHPWLSARPEKAVLQCWAVSAEADGHEDWHMHPAGWLSGGFYAAMPEATAEGSEKAGCISFGLPPGLIGEDAADAFGLETHRPAPGSLLLFPSHAYHRTWPHGTRERRLCIAFDIVPA